MPVKTTSCLFQHVRDRLYLTPPSLDEHTSSTSAYLGALGFTKPQEKIVLRTISDTYRWWHEAKETGQGSQQELVGAEGSPGHVPVLEGVSLAKGESCQAASPKGLASEEEHDLEIVRDVVWHLHAVRLQAMHDMGCVREVEQAAVRTLLAEFARLQAILGEDLTRSLSALRSELEALSEAVLADVLNMLIIRPAIQGSPG